MTKTKSLKTEHSPIFQCVLTRIDLTEIQQENLGDE